MLAVPDAPNAAAWYRAGLGGPELWNLGSVIGLTIGGAPLFLGQPENDKWATPAAVGAPTVRVEVFVDDPDAFVSRAVERGADGSDDPVRDQQKPWGTRSQGS